MAIKLPESVEAALIASGLAERDETPGAPAANAPAAFPSVSLNETPGFIVPAWYRRLQFALLSPDQHGACLFGPRGAGKTTAVHHAAKQAGIELVTFQAAAGNTIDDLTGQRDLIDGKTVFTPGPLPQAIQRDCWLLIEEANMLHPGTLSKLNTLTDGSGDSLRLPNGEALEVGPRFRVLLAFNEGSNYAGTREVNAALRDRLMPIYCDYFPAEQEQEMLIAKTGIGLALACSIVGMANAVRSARDTLQVDISPRSLCRLIRLAQCLGESWPVAFEHAILDLIGDPIDRRPQREAVLQAALVAGLDSWPPAGVSLNETLDGTDGDA